LDLRLGEGKKSLPPGLEAEVFLGLEAGGWIEVGLEFLGF
jgi:hypothetical protein